MKILVVCQYYYPEPFRIHEVCEELSARGHEVTVLTGLPNYPMGVIPEEYLNGQRRDEVVNGVRIVRVNETPRKEGKVGLARNYVSYVWHASLKALTLGRFDVTLVYQLSPVLMAIPAFVARAVFKCRNIRLYCLDLWPESLVSMNISRNSLFFKFIKHVSRSIYNGVNVLGYTSEMFEDYFKNDLKLKQKNYRFIPQFADSLFEDITPTVHEGINYVFAGNIGKMQSVETVIRAAALVNDDRIRWHIVGDGFALEDVKKLAEELKVNDKVTFYGRLPVEKMPEFYAMADAMLVTLAKDKTISYTLPGKVQSYMAAARPILASADGETARVMDKAKCGMCVAAEDAEALANAAIKMADANLAEYGRNASDYYKSNYSKKKHIDLMEELLK